MPIKKTGRQISLKPPYLSWPSIRKEAENFREKFVCPANTIPVPIDKIAECTLRLDVIPISGMLEEIDIDGFLTNDLKAICIDREIYMDPRQENRLRFTYAHEIGHLVLHRDEIQQCTFRTPEEWIHFHEDFSAFDLDWFENQGREFGGRLLVPKQDLISEILKYRDQIRRYKSEVSGEDYLSDTMARMVCKKFGVSDQVIQRRIRIEKIWGAIKSAL